MLTSASSTSSLLFSPPQSCLAIIKDLLGQVTLFLMDQVTLFLNLMDQLGHVILFLMDLLGQVTPFLTCFQNVEVIHYR